MSELFNALQKLEEKNTSAAPSLPPLASGAGKDIPKQKIPYLKSLLLLALITIMTAIGIFVLSTEKENIFPLQVEQALPDLSVDPQFTPEATVVLPPDTLEQLDISEKTDNLVSPAVTGEGEIHLLSVAEAEKIGEKETENQQAAPVAPDFGGTTIVTGEMVIFPENIEVFLDPLESKEVVENDTGQDSQQLSTEMIHKKRQQAREEFTRKRLLQSAERLRHEGELIKALELYKQAWHKKQGAALANNIAAILIGLHSYQEAEHYLRQALRFSPGDPYILFNLKLIGQGQNRAIQ